MTFTDLVYLYFGGGLAIGLFGLWIAVEGKYGEEFEKLEPTPIVLLWPLIVVRLLFLACQTFFPSKEKPHEP